MHITHLSYELGRPNSNAFEVAIYSSHPSKKSVEDSQPNSIQQKSVFSKKVPSDFLKGIQLGQSESVLSSYLQNPVSVHVWRSPQT